jgi:hypothetical protein
MNFRNLQLSALAAGAVLLAPLAAHAQWWQQHPAYLHAMSDLRQAYWLVAHRDSMDPVAKVEEQQAKGAIRAAYQNLKDAAIVDDKNIDDQPPPEMDFSDHGGRLHRAMDLLRDAHNAVDKGEDDPAARGFKQRALSAIDHAAAATNAAMHAWNF